MKIESKFSNGLLKDKTYVNIKKPRVQSPMSDDIDDMDDSDIDEKIKVQVKGPKKKVK
jgi:hypothetical protein